MERKRQKLGRQLEPIIKEHSVTDGVQSNYFQKH